MELLKTCKQGIDIDIDRQKVIEYLKDSEFNLTNCTMENFEVGFKGLTLIDQEGRKIFAYNNPLLDSVEIIYDKLQLTEDEVIYEIKEALWEDYLTLAKQINEGVVIHKPNRGEIQFLRHKINDSSNETHRSKIFKENELYDIHEYLLNQVQQINNRVRKEKIN